MNHDDLSSGERRKVGARVDSGIYSAFLDWVEDEYGREYGNTGRALDRAMLEFMDRDRAARIEEDTDEIVKTVKHNNAMLRKLQGHLENGHEKKKKIQIEKTIPEGKSPKDRKQREMLVLEALLKNFDDKVQGKAIEKAVRQIANVSSPSTVKNYKQTLTETKAFDELGGDNYRLNREAATALLEQNGMDLDGEEAVA